MLCSCCGETLIEEEETFCYQCETAIARLESLSGMSVSLVLRDDIFADYDDTLYNNQTIH